MNYLYSTAFTECLHHHKIQDLQKSEFDKTLIIKVHAPQLHSNQRLAISGSIEELGNWNTDKSLHCIYTDNNEWTAVMDISNISAQQIEMKFIILDDDRDVPVIWEDRMNRTLIIPELQHQSIKIINMEPAHFSMPVDRIAGTAIPVFSLRSEGSFGVGDFGDLKQMIDWISQTGQHILQVLPINDTTLTRTWTDCYPYSAISIFAIHPQYIDFRQLPELNDKSLSIKYEVLRKELNSLPQIDYERVNNAKNEYLHLIFNQDGQNTLRTDDFRKWFNEEKQWLVPYAQYSTLRDKYNTPDFSRWHNHETWNEADRDVLSNPETDEYKGVSFYYYVQYILAQQMISVHKYAREHGVILKGDIPIGVNRQGCDVWQEPRYFNLDGSAGTPPDYFSRNGQNWGFPTYNWDEMIKDGCQWWIRRFSNMSKYFDAYRIDHVLGFFRIWEIPTHSVHGLLGQFQPSLGMTRYEVEQYGLKWQEDFFLNPFITDWVLDRMFGENKDYVKETFIEKWHDDLYRFREEYRTQRQVEQYFASNGELTENDIAIRDALYSLQSNVLFVVDHRNPELVHPRITAQCDTCYETLWGHDKYNYDRLYNDYFYNRNNQFWYNESMRKLPKLIDATKMLVCAEDLGMVPECVAWVMNQLEILSLEMETMPKNPCMAFGVLEYNPYLSVCTISSHDTATLRMWWDEDIERVQKYWNLVLGCEGPAPHPLSSEIAEKIIWNHLACPSMLCIITLQDWLAMNDELKIRDASRERINVPANPKHYWRYRMHLNIEDLIKADDFNRKIKQMISDARR